MIMSFVCVGEGVGEGEGKRERERGEGGREGGRTEWEDKREKREIVQLLFFLLRFNIGAQAPDCVDPVSK